MSLKPYVGRKPLDDKHVHDTLQLIEGALHAVHRREAGLLSFEEVYRNAYHLVMNKRGAQLYQLYKEVEQKHLERWAAELMQSNEKDFLPNLQEMWKAHCTNLGMISDIFMYLDRHYVKDQKLTPVYDEGIRLFLECVCHSSLYPIRDRIWDNISNQIRQERQGQIIESAPLKSAISMLITVAPPLDTKPPVYQQDFEIRFLEETAQFYAMESARLLEDMDIPQYLVCCEKRLKEEEIRADFYLDPSTKSDLIKIVLQKLIAAPSQKLIDSDTGLMHMIAADKLQDVRRMYRLFTKVEDGVKRMRDCTMKSIQSQGEAINHEFSEDATTWCQRVIDLNRLYDSLLRQTLDNDKAFQWGFSEAFRTFVKKSDRSAEFVVVYLDDQMKKGFKGLDDEEIDAIIDQTIAVFRYVEDRDVFERFYRQYLAKRLLLRRNVSDEFERAILQKLKRECGHQYTQKLEGMLNDVAVSAELMGSYGKLSKSLGLRVELNVVVLTAMNWPVSMANPPLLPTELAAPCTIFFEHYTNRHIGRKLTWLTNLGSADLKARFPRKPVELLVNTPAMLVLLLFNDADQLSYEEIAQRTGLRPSELKKALQSLSCAKYKILLKSTKSREVEDSDVFSYNGDFSSPLARLKILNIATKAESKADRAETLEKVEEDRRFVIEACIVRVMKSRKKLSHVHLVAEVTQQLSNRFLPDPQIIKKRIEGLIEKEYLERSPQDRNSYTYIS